MKYILIAVTVLFMSGCATWEGIKQDTKTGVNWTKEKLHNGANYVEKKTE
ncbi:MAG: hypothetical protein R3331_11120 [Sulfurospirillaceae bacterium]|nr:hypothetical protein [Sulfurospirillaceae bacterium]